VFGNSLNWIQPNGFPLGSGSSRSAPHIALHLMLHTHTHTHTQKHIYIYIYILTELFFLFRLSGLLLLEEFEVWQKTIL
jgi:hypothetical protein